MRVHAEWPWLGLFAVLALSSTAAAEGIDRAPRPVEPAPDESTQPVPRFLLIGNPGAPAADCPMAEYESDALVVCRIMLPIPGVALCRRIDDAGTWVCSGQAIVPGAAPDSPSAPGSDI